MKRMLINATQEEELRMALVDGQRLYDLNIEQPSRQRKKANIYKGRITRIEPSLEAAFVDYGAERHGFLPLKEISPEYFVNGAKTDGRVNIREVLREGQDIVVQIDKEERGNKGAALTTYVSLAGRFIVLKPNKPRSGGVSRRITGEDRDLARDSLDEVDIPDGMSVILRTAGIGRGPEELEWDVENLLGIWNAILKVVVERSSPFLIYQERDAVIRSLRDYMSNEIGEVLIDNEATYKEARDFVEQVMPHNLRKIKHYDDTVPLFTRYQIESQIESAFAHSVTLPSGGSIVIDHTEALISIDINSARATKGDDIEATALNTNLEAADEIARQLRLRDLGGLIVIDFIDMGPQKNQRAVENRLREAVRIDRARVQIGKISRFGLLEMSRQRLRPSLGESTNEVCPRCNGMGNIRSVESLALAILRLVGEETRKERTSKVIADLPTDVATYLLNEKREWVQSLEDNNDVHIVLIANPDLDTPHYSIRRVRDDQTELPENTGSSYNLSESTDDESLPTWTDGKPPAEQAAVIAVAPTTPAPIPQPVAEPQKPGLFVRLWRALFAAGDEQKPAKQRKRKTTRRSKSESSSTRSRSGNAKRTAKSTKKRKDTGEQRKSTEQKADAGAKRKKRTKKSDSGSDRKKTEQTDTPTQKKAESESNNEGGRKRRRSRGRRRNRSNETPNQAANGSEKRPSKSASPADEKRPSPARADSDSPTPSNGAAQPRSSGNGGEQASKSVNAKSDVAPPSADTAPASKGPATPPSAKPAAAQSPTAAPSQPRADRSSAQQPAAQNATPSPAAAPRDVPKPAAPSVPSVTPKSPTQSQQSTATASASGPSPAAPRAKPADRPPAADKPPGNKDRLLPWESAPGVTDKSFGGDGD
ncbi:MAG: Rne/Rng family ribonuclease [Pseudomonadota bacterium]